MLGGNIQHPVEECLQTKGSSNSSFLTRTAVPTGQQRELWESCCPYRCLLTTLSSPATPCWKWVGEWRVGSGVGWGLPYPREAFSALFPTTTTTTFWWCFSELRLPASLGTLLGSWEPVWEVRSSISPDSNQLLSKAKSRVETDPGPSPEAEAAVSITHPFFPLRQWGK